MNEITIIKPGAVVERSEILKLVEQRTLTLANATTVEQIRRVELEADAIEDLMRGTGLFTQADMVLANELRMRARYRLGVALGKVAREPAGRPSKNSSRSGNNFGERIKAWGLDKNRAAEAQRIAAMPVVEFEKVLAQVRAKVEPISVAGLIDKAKTWWKKEKRATKEKELGEELNKPLPKNRRFGVILADPAWQFVVRSEKGMDRAADNHYPTEPVESIKALTVQKIAADHCVLFLWVTVPFLKVGLEVMEAWGFDYKSNFVWIKDKPGTGYWNRNRHEHLLLGVKGNPPAPAMGDQFDSVIEAARREHSVKPADAHEIAEKYFPSLPKVELYAREQRTGWQAWGAEADWVPEL